MSGYDFKVPPLSWEQIRAVSDNLRTNLGLASEPYFPIMEVIERVLDQRLGLVRLEVGTYAEMKGAEGHTCPSGDFIELRNDVYVAAWKGEGRARFTAAHELGHLLLHTNVPLARAKQEDNVKPFRRSEPQANRFAAELLMPPRFFAPSDDIGEVAKRHGVSMEAAHHRLSDLKKRGKL
ncbi:MAG: hypothetical protein Kow00114_12910 [Kiloniellaceae bacterium]